MSFKRVSVIIFYLAGNTQVRLTLDTLYCDTGGFSKAKEANGKKCNKCKNDYKTKKTNRNHRRSI